MTGMTGINSTMDSVQVRVYIFFLSSIAPLSILHTILLLARPVLPEPFRTFCLPLAIQVWLIAETVAYVFLYLPFKYYFLQLSANHPETLSREEREKLFTRCWATVSDPERYLSQWFRGANREDIKRENVREWIYWAFFNTRKVTEQEDEEVEFYLSETERLLGRTLPPGKSNVKSIRLTLDAVDCSHRSLFWYFVSYFSPLLNAGLLILMLIVYHGCRYYHIFLDALQRVPFLSQLSLTILHIVSISTSCGYLNREVSSKVPHVLASTASIRDQAPYTIYPWYRCRSLSIHQLPSGHQPRRSVRRRRHTGWSSRNRNHGCQFPHHPPSV